MQKDAKPAPMEPLELLFRALTAAPHRLSVGLLIRSLIEVRRKSRRRGPDARISITDQMAKELRQNADESMRPVYLLVGIPRDLAVELEAIKHREESRIVTLDQHRADLALAKAGSRPRLR